MKITRDVVSDLWPLVASGEASPDTRALVDEFLRADPDFAGRLAAPAALPAAEVTLPPEAEARAFASTRDLLHGRRWLRALRLVALALTGLTVARAFEHATWDEPTREVAATALAACVAWILYAVLLHRARARALGGGQRRVPQS